MKFSFYTAVSALLFAVLLNGCSDAGARNNPNDPGGVAVEDGEVTGEEHNYSVYDSRDKKTYKVAKIGNNYWLAENLNYSTSNSFCYDGDSKNCKTYGRLYRWTTDDLCPTGWKIPTQREWSDLFDESNGYVRLFLAGNNVWGEGLSNGNSYGFSIMPAGYRAADGTYIGLSNLAGFWTRTSGDDNKAYSVWVEYENVYPDIITYDKQSALSVRCIKER